jgi:hypothetical protein
MSFHPRRLQARATLVLVLLCAVLQGCRKQLTTQPWRAADGGAGIPVTYRQSDSGAVQCAEGGDYQSFVRPLIEQRCLSCHSVTKSGSARNAAPLNVNFDTEADVLARAQSIKLRAVEQRNMPPGAPLDDCAVWALGVYLNNVVSGCSPICTGRQCGSDGCGGSCGNCPAGAVCEVGTGQCLAPKCIGSCEAAACGDDGCGASCGECAEGKSCTSDRQCACTPKCDGRSCGDDGCGGSCGSCLAGEVCSHDGQCTCVPDCTGKLCGDNGCGGSCGSCGVNQQCSADQSSCMCVPSCVGNCGSDGCGGSCGSCKGAMVCNTRSGQCQANCTPDCTNRVCGDDGCGGSCGSACQATQVCTKLGQCTCAPNCIGRACGADGCGGSCGSCSSDTSCSTSGQCVCSPDCTNRSCGDDGCGGSCGSCAGSNVCQSGACVDVCVASCTGKTCGDDGCGGSCGSCTNPQTCNQGQCAWPDKSFASDVYPIFQSTGCADNACHAGARPRGESRAVVGERRLPGVGQRGGEPVRHTAARQAWRASLQLPSQ